jgi:light-regulated signal transduction histidine kinase (bacteriophytochrome)/uncharacterized protein YjbJ (UPF0337 family)
MNQDMFASQWRQMRGSLQAWWGKLKDEDVERIGGQKDKLIGVLQEKYGYTRGQAQHEVERRLQAYGDTTRGPSGSGIANAAETIASLTAQAQEGDAMVALQHSNEELQQFGYIVSHDLTEPLRTVTNYLQLLAQRYQGKLDAAADEYIAFAVDGAQHMQKLIRALRAYTQVGGSADVVCTAVDCEALLVRTLHSLAIAIQETGADVTHDPLPTVRGDTYQLGLVLQNLIGNALKFRGNAAPRIHISAQREARGWRFVVRDNGIGIAPEHGERIFQVFQRLHTRREYPGMGIGLAICKKIIEHHGGRIWVESTPGQGSVFVFTISEMEGEKV